MQACPTMDRLFGRGELRHWDEGRRRRGPCRSRWAGGGLCAHASRAAKEGGAFLLGEIVDEHHIVGRQRPSAAERYSRDSSGSSPRLDWTCWVDISPASVRGTGVGIIHRRGFAASTGPFRARSGKHFANGRRRTGQHRSRRAGPNWAHNASPAGENNTRQDTSARNGPRPSVF